MPQVANVRSTANRIVPFGLLPGFAPGSNVGNRAAKADLKDVSAWSERLLYVETVCHEHILCPSDVLPVEPNTRDGIEAFGDEFNVLVMAEVRLYGKPTSITPVFLLDPLELLFVGPPERIGYALVPKKVTMDAARNLGREPVARLRLEERPGR